jgi:hypothetical protein
VSCREDGRCPIHDSRLAEHLVSTWDLRLRDDSAGLPPCVAEVDPGRGFGDDDDPDTVDDL